MSDPRITPANDRVALRGWSVPGRDQAIVEGEPARIARPVVDLNRTSKGPRDRQLLYGEGIIILETFDDSVFVQSTKDGYVGYLRADDVAAPVTATHWVSAPASHLYTEPDLKSPDRTALSFGSQLSVLSEQGAFLETPDGFAPRQHLHELGKTLADPVSASSLFIGTPYLWGGNSRWGVDCSGLVQLACLACGIPCPGDSDQQQANLGTFLPPDTQMQPGDLLFWKGHVAWVEAENMLLHANAHHMAVALEPLQPALDRISQNQYGAITAHKRLT